MDGCGFMGKMFHSCFFIFLLVHMKQVGFQRDLPYPRPETAEGHVSFSFRFLVTTFFGRGLFFGELGCSVINNNAYINRIRPIKGKLLPPFSPSGDRYRAVIDPVPRARGG